MTAALATAALATAALVGGCGGGEDASTPASTASPTTAPDTSTTGSPGPGAVEDVEELAEWQTIELVDADGVTFRIGDLVGEPVFVETFATWCSNCRRQLGDTQKAAEQAGDEAAFVVLSVETTLDEADMAEYAADHGFDAVRFAVMSPEMLAAMEEAFGNSVLNPPSTPHVAVAADGTVGELVTGYDAPGEILTSLGLS